MPLGFEKSGTTYTQRRRGTPSARLACLPTQVLEVDAAGTTDHREDRHARQFRCADESDVGRRDDQGRVALVTAQRTGDEVHPLLRTDGDDDRLRVDGNAFVRFEVAGDLPMDDALRAPVLEQGGDDLRFAVTPVGGQELPVATQAAFEVVEGEEILARAPRGERDRLREARGHLVEKVHRIQHRITQRGVELRDVHPANLAAGLAAVIRDHHRYALPTPQFRPPFAPGHRNTGPYSATR